MSEKINIGQAIAFGDGHMEVQLNITALTAALETDEVKLALRNFLNKGGEPQTSIKILISKLEPEFVNKYQTHSVRIDTYYRQK